MNTVSDPRSVTGIIIRDEQVFYAERDGRLEFLVHDNERVAVGTLVANVQNPAMVGVATERLSMVEDQALDAHSRRYITDTTVQSLNNNLGNIVTSRAHNFATMNLSEIYALRDNASQVINTRNQISVNDGVASRENLAREQYRHTSVLEYNSQNMYASVSGIMSRIIDGKEYELNASQLNYLTSYDLRQQLENVALVPAQQVETGDAAFKIVGNTWYIAVELPTETIANFVQGTNRTIYLRNPSDGVYEPHSMRIHEINLGTRYSMIIFRSNRHVIDFIDQRSVSVRVSSGEESGLLVPETAITTRRHFRIPGAYIHGFYEHYVVISSAGETSSLLVTVENRAEGYAYLSIGTNLSLGSLLVPNSPDAPHMHLSSDHLQELHGIYLDRLGFARFAAINIGDSTMGGGYILLDPALNPGISEFANIVTNADSVVEGQLIR